MKITEAERKSTWTYWFALGGTQRLSGSRRYALSRVFLPGERRVFALGTANVLGGRGRTAPSDRICGRKLVLLKRLVEWTWKDCAARGTAASERRSQDDISGTVLNETLLLGDRRVFALGTTRVPGGRGRTAPSDRKTTTDDEYAR